MEKKVSIIIPVYNAEKYIQETIDCVRSQTWKEWELLLVLNGCTDGSAEVIRRYRKQVKDERIRVIEMSGNQGAAKARNQGLMEATGRYIAYLDADDLWSPEKLELELAYMEEKQAAFVFTGYEFADETGKGLGKIVHVPEQLEYREALKNTTIFTSTVMFDTVKIAKKELEMPLIKSEDTALWWRILRQGYTAYGMDKIVVKYRRSGGTLSANKLEAIRRIWALYRKAEGLSLIRSMYYFCFWAVRAVKRRL